MFSAAPMKRCAPPRFHREVDAGVVAGFFRHRNGLGETGALLDGAGRGQYVEAHRHGGRVAVHDVDFVLARVQRLARLCSRLDRPRKFGRNEDAEDVEAFFQQVGGIPARWSA